MAKFTQPAKPSSANIIALRLRFKMIASGAATGVEVGFTALGLSVIEKASEMNSILGV